MPFPLNPPPASDYGAFTIPRMLQRWLDVNPVSKLTRTQAYITLPAFSVANTWLGYSDIIAAFNYEGPNNFTLVGFNVEPLVNPNYCLCIMWKDQYGNVNRFSLWRGVGEVIYLNVPMYNGQKIAKNFRFEIWSTNSTPLVQVTPIQIYTSVLGGIDYRFGSDFQLVNNDAVVTAFSTGVIPPVTSPPTTGLAAHWRADTFTSIFWADTVSGFLLTPTNVVQTSNPSILNGQPYLDMSAGGMTNAGTGNVINIPITGPAVVFVICSKKTISTGFFLVMSDASDTPVVSITTGDTNQSWGIAAEVLNDTTAESLPNFIVVQQQGNTFGALLGLESFNEISGTEIAVPTTSIENLNIFEGPNLLAEILVYSSIASQADLTQLKQYIANRYVNASLFALPLVFPSNSSPTQNEVIQP